MAVYFKDGKPHSTTSPELAVQLTQRDAVLQRMLREEGYSSMDDLMKEDMSKFLPFRKKLFRNKR